MPAISPSCATCQHFHEGFCRRFPPVAIMTSDSGLPQIHSAFPPVKQDWLCGEFSRKVSTEGKSTNGR